MIYFNHQSISNKNEEPIGINVKTKKMYIPPLRNVGSKITL